MLTSFKIKIENMDNKSLLFEYRLSETERMIFINDDMIKNKIKIDTIENKQVIIENEILKRMNGGLTK